MTPAKQRAARRSDALSKDLIVATAIEILDSEGEGALTFRALARRLSTGSGALYHHVANKDDVLRAATGQVIASTTHKSEHDAAPADAIRALILGIFDAIDAHPWVGAQLAREPWQVPLLDLFDAVAERLDADGVAERTQFDAASVLVHYVLGVAAQYAAAARALAGGADPSALLRAAVEQRAGERSPVAARLTEHDDREQLRAGVDLVLAGIAALKGRP
ncbi:TetR/AcrR family transcriptional regulator [Streptomyces mesophilus]|uniref:TetR/AcrR family transcriptional regulator n=1 Tax=Streptomyces mesophilus TaxID=1775132 RepID=UPI00331A1030